MEIDLNFVRARFAGMTLDELLEEIALRADEYTPLARSVLEGEARSRGITAARIEERRRAERRPADDEDDAAAIDLPALLTSSSEKSHVLDLVRVLGDRGIPAAVRELDTRAFHGSGHLVGRWGLMVPGPRAGEAARILEQIAPPSGEDAAAAGCGSSCGSCGGGGASDEEWPEDGDWWKTGAGEDEEEEPPR